METVNDVIKKRNEDFARFLAEGMTQVEAAKAVGITAPSEAALAMKASRLARSEGLQGTIVDEMKRVRREALESIDDRTIQKMGGKDRVMAAAILTDKIELLEGRATERTASVQYVITAKASGDQPVRATRESVEDSGGQS